MRNRIRHFFLRNRTPGARLLWRRIREIALAMLAIGLISAAFWMIYRPLGLLVAGAFLLAEVLTAKGGR